MIDVGQRWLKIAICCLFLSAASLAFSAEVLYVQTPSDGPNARHDLEAATKIYGLDLRVVVLASAKDSAKALGAIKGDSSVAVVLTPQVLQILGGQEILKALGSTKQRKPLLLVGITERTDSRALGALSAGEINGCVRSSLEGASWFEIGRSDQLTAQLSGSKLPLTGSEVRHLTFGEKRHVESLMSATNGTVQLAVFAGTVNGTQEVYFATAPVAIIPVNSADIYREPALFSLLAPELLFLHHAAGERAWHSTGHYANLTIDDAWLREPFGYVRYDGLLQEMQQHRFHTTIAFIPWNYDRSQPSVVALFREHPDKYSICVHGNNHNHQEFGPFEDRPLAGQVQDIKQGLARLEAFSKLTGLPYDPVMVFPHKISPEATLASLKRYNFWATTNADNVPSDSVAPSDPRFELRASTLSFADFPSMRRYSAEYPIPEAQLAIDAFLGNPMLFYAHEAFFAPGIGAFDGVADKVNQIQPDTKWGSLGDVVRHLYLERLRDDGNYDVQLHSSEIQVTNIHKHDAVYFLEKDEDGVVPFTVSIDGHSQPFEFTQGKLRVTIPIPAGASREISIKYQNDLVVSAVDISKSSLRISAIRYLSDFRDNIVSQTAVGRWFIRSYLLFGNIWNIGAVCIVVLLAGLCWRLKAKKKGSAGNGMSSMSSGSKDSKPNLASASKL